MMGRFLVMALAQLTVALVGWWVQGAIGMALAVLVMGLVLAGIQQYRGARLIAWLRQGELRDSPFRYGLCGEVAERVQRTVRRLEQQDRDSQARLHNFLAAIQASPNGVVLLDAKGGIEWCNQTAAEHFGINAERDREQLIGNLVRDPDFAAYATGKDFGHEIVIAGRSASASRPVRLSVQIHPYADGLGAGKRLLLSRDVTALEQAEVMRRDFVANVSHEIRTPLTVLSGFVETLQTLPLSGTERERYLGMMAVQSQRMQTLVQDLLTLSRLEGTPPPGMQEWTTVAKLQLAFSQEAQALAEGMAGTGPLGLQLVFQPPPAKALAGSSAELLSALSNLVNNAVRYTPAGGKIEVHWTPLADGRLEFAVRDTGPGIATEHIPRLTERFYRVDRSRSRETGGTGLGLAIVKHVAQRHGAELRIDSKPGQGSRFALVFAALRVRDLPAVQLLAEPV